MTVAKLQRGSEPTCFLFVKTYISLTGLCHHFVDYAAAAIERTVLCRAEGEIGDAVDGVSYRSVRKSGHGRADGRRYDLIAARHWRVECSSAIEIRAITKNRAGSRRLRDHSPVAPENFVRADSRNDAESAHHST
jgi:hypothetical protein